MKTVDIRGEITSNYIGGIYEYARTHDEWFRADYTCPAGVKAVIDSLEDGEELEVIVNSGGGDVMSGQEIYAMLKRHLRPVIRLYAKSSHWQQAPQV